MKSHDYKSPNTVKDVLMIQNIDNAIVSVTCQIARNDNTTRFIDFIAQTRF